MTDTLATVQAEAWQWTKRNFPGSSGMHGLAVYEPTLVEALAQAWLAVLKKARRG